MTTAAFARASISARQRARVHRVWGPSASQCMSCFAVRQLGNGPVPKCWANHWNVKNAYSRPQRARLLQGVRWFTHRHLHTRVRVYAVCVMHARVCGEGLPGLPGSAVCDCFDVGTGDATALDTAGGVIT